MGLHKPASSQPAEAHPDEQPAPGELAIQLHGLEDRTLRRMDEIVGGFNQVLQVGLGEVKYPVALHDWLLEWDPDTKGNNFPQHQMAVNFNLEDFKLTMVEFKGAFCGRLNLCQAVYVMNIAIVIRSNEHEHVSKSFRLNTALGH